MNSKAWYAVPVVIAAFALGQASAPSRPVVNTPAVPLITRSPEVTESYREKWLKSNRVIEKKDRRIGELERQFSSLEEKIEHLPEQIADENLIDGQRHYINQTKKILALKKNIESMS